MQRQTKKKFVSNGGKHSAEANRQTTSTRCSARCCRLQLTQDDNASNGDKRLLRQSYQAWPACSAGLKGGKFQREGAAAVQSAVIVIADEGFCR
jgi:hypothetical protein